MSTLLILSLLIAPGITMTIKDPKPDQEICQLDLNFKLLEALLLKETTYPGLKVLKAECIDT